MASGDDLPQPMSIFDLWEHNQRVPPLTPAFRPGEQVDDDEFNLFQGFAVRSIAGEAVIECF